VIQSHKYLYLFLLFVFVSVFVFVFGSPKRILTVLSQVISAILGRTLSAYSGRIEWNKQRILRSGCYWWRWWLCNYFVLFNFCFV